MRESVARARVRPARVAGGAGTGKTVVAMHRARHLARTPCKPPQDRILFTSYTANLAQNVEQKDEGAIHISLVSESGWPHPIPSDPPPGGAWGVRRGAWSGRTVARDQWPVVSSEAKEQWPVASECEERHQGFSEDCDAGAIGSRLPRRSSRAQQNEKSPMFRSRNFGAIHVLTSGRR